MKLQLGIRSWEQSERSSTRSLPLDLKFGGAEIRGSKFAAARNWKSAARFKAWEQLERASTRNLPVDLKFGDYIRSWLEVRREFAARLRSPLYSKPGSS